jgi:hypothetical protein
MKFKIVRDFEEFMPMVWNEVIGTWHNVTDYPCSTIESARKACEFYKKMKDDPVVEEFEL